MDFVLAFIISQVVTWACFSVLIAPGVNDWRENKKQLRIDALKGVPEVKASTVPSTQARRVSFGLVGQRVVPSAHPIEVSPALNDPVAVPQSRS